MMEKEELHNYTATSNLNLIIKHNLTAQNLHNYLAISNLNLILSALGPQPLLRRNGLPSSWFLPVHHVDIASGLERNKSEVSLGREQALPFQLQKGKCLENLNLISRHMHFKNIASDSYFLEQLIHFCWLING